MTTMMEFLVKIEIDIALDFSAQDYANLLVQERTRGRELQEQGSIQRIWRIPGTKNNVGIWCASDATHLHSLLASLPLYRFMKIDVISLAVHPLEEDKK